MFGAGLLGCIFLSFGCLIAAFRSLASIGQAYDRESRIMAVNGFIFGIIGSIFFGLGAIYRLNSIHQTTKSMIGN